MAEVIDKVMDWASRLEAFREGGLWDACRTYYKDNEQQLVKMNTEQMMKGLTPEGLVINPLLRSGMPPTLYNTGAFHQSIYIEADEDKILFTASDPKWGQRVPPSMGWNVTMTPLHEVYGDVLGIPADMEEAVERARNESISDTFRAMFA